MFVVHFASALCTAVIKCSFTKWIRLASCWNSLNCIASILNHNFVLINHLCRWISYGNSWQILFSTFQSFRPLKRKKLERIKRDYYSLCCLLLIAMMASIHKLLSIQLCAVVVVGAHVLDFTDTTRWVSQAMEVCTQYVQYFMGFYLLLNACFSIERFSWLISLWLLFPKNKKKKTKKKRWNSIRPDSKRVEWMNKK